ncbi:hypothetical protein ACLEPN_02825 [Myxococcus sp. 1LA]
MSTHPDADGPRLLAGEPLREEGSQRQATLGGWFRLRDNQAPVLLTVEHVLTPDAIRRASACLGAGDSVPRLRWHRQEGVVDRRPEGRWLCHATSGARVARVLASGARDETGRVALLDACIAAPVNPGLGSAEYPPLAWTPRPAAPHVGRPVLKFTRHGGLRHGKVLSVSAAGEVLIASVDDRPFAVEGDSGALVIDVEARAAVALHVGEVYQRQVDGQRWPVLWRALAVPLLMDAFRLADY